MTKNSLKFPEHKTISYPDIMSGIMEQWEKEDVFRQLLSDRKDEKPFVFYEGPPSANGTPGIHHVMSRTIKDIFCRYKSMKGFLVERKGGWDTHGLPIELQVEKELGIVKDDIGNKISVAEYNEKCRETVMKFKGDWERLTQMMGYWVDMETPYITFDKKYIETLWYLIKQFFEKGMLYKGYTIQPYSPAAGTGLSSHELNQPGTYRDVKDTTIVAEFKVKQSPQSDFLFDTLEEDVRMIAWTTTPWTLPANCALAVGKNIEYVKVKTQNPYTHLPVSVVLAKELVKKHFKSEEGEKSQKPLQTHVSDIFKGKDLIDIRYEQLMPYVTNEELERKAFRVIGGDFVTTTEGTGIVHTASVFGADDFRVCKENDVPSVMVKDENGTEIPIVDKQGKFVPEITDFAGRFVKSEFYSQEEQTSKDFKPTDVLIAIQLKEENKAFWVEKYEHSYPHCWRTDKPILYYPLDSWFIKTTAIKDKLIALNKTINWKPNYVGEGRFGNWLENLVDWNLSRSRFWGTPLPIWRTEDMSETKCIGSTKELELEVEKSVKKGLMKEPIDETFDLHRPYVDEIILVSDSGKPMKREADLIDVWFDSGAMPFAQLHWPFDSTKTLSDHYPADFIAEGLDQTRGWFYTLHIISVAMQQTVAFKNVIVNGLVLDKNGNKMSKRLGNAIDPFYIIEKYGADAVRWYMIINSNPWENLKFDEAKIGEVQRKMFNTLSNTYSFFAIYANLDGFVMDWNQRVSYQDKPRMDRWILSELHQLALDVDESYSDYEPTRVARFIQDFVNGSLSNWYVRLSRKRFWKSSLNQDKQSAYETLFECLMSVAQLMCPIAPFYADWIFRNLSQNMVCEGENPYNLEAQSIHLTHFVRPDKKMIDKDLNMSMSYAQKISSLVHSIRKKEKIKVRQPLLKMLIPISDEKQKQHIVAVQELICAETNVKEITYVDNTDSILVKKIKPNFNRLGSRLGAKMKEVTKAIMTLRQEDILEVENTQKLNLSIQGETISLTLEDVEISFQDISGWSVVSEDKLIVALDIQINEALQKEGLSREIVNRIQNFRKKSNLEIQDKINVTYSTTNAMLQEAIQEHTEYILKEVQAYHINQIDELNEGENFDIEEMKLHLDIKKA